MKEAIPNSQGDEQNKEPAEKPDSESNDDSENEILSSDDGKDGVSDLDRQKDFEAII